jgi:hypothetical protein
MSPSVTYDGLCYHVTVSRNGAEKTYSFEGVLGIYTRNSEDLSLKEIRKMRGKLEIIVDDDNNISYLAVEPNHFSRVRPLWLSKEEAQILRAEIKLIVEESAKAEQSHREWYERYDSSICSCCGYTNMDCHGHKAYYGKNRAYVLY